MLERYFRNRLSGESTLSANEARQSLKAALEKYCLKGPTHRPSVYTGAAGVAYACWHVHRHSEAISTVVNSQELLAAAAHLSRSARQAVERYPPEEAGWSLLAGHAGCYATSALVLHAAAAAAPGSSEQQGELQAESEGCIRAYRDLAPLALSSACREDEFLYGRAGYLFGSLMLNTHVRADAVPAATLEAVVQKVLSSGRQTAAALRDPGTYPTPLFFLWPPDAEAAPYLGAAHGLMGILYVLLHFPDLLRSLAGMQRDVEASLDYMLSLECDAEGRQCPHGHYPTQMGPLRDREPLVHWCHGATGAVFLLCRAHEVLGAARYLEAALRSGEAVWERGLLRKGPGACHGVSGSAYALLKLYRTTQDPRWLHRAQQFAHFMNSEEFREGARTPDHPHSLLEGWAAAACLWADLLQPDRAGFPFFELDI